MLCSFLLSLWIKLTLIASSKCFLLAMETYTMDFLCNKEISINDYNISLQIIAKDINFKNIISSNCFLKIKSKQWKTFRVVINAFPTTNCSSPFLTIENLNFVKLQRVISQCGDNAVKYRYDYFVQGPFFIVLRQISGQPFEYDIIVTPHSNDTEVILIIIILFGIFALVFSLLSSMFICCTFFYSRQSIRSPTHSINHSNTTLNTDHNVACGPEHQMCPVRISASRLINEYNILQSSSELHKPIGIHKVDIHNQENINSLLQDRSFLPLSNPSHNRIFPSPKKKSNTSSVLSSTKQASEKEENEQSNSVYNDGRLPSSKKESKTSIVFSSTKQASEKEENDFEKKIDEQSNLEYSNGRLPSSKKKSNTSSVLRSAKQASEKEKNDFEKKGDEQSNSIYSDGRLGSSSYESTGSILRQVWSSPI